MIILLDLNYTLVENSHEKAKPFHKQIAGEQYRRWLIDLLWGREVILITARPEYYRAETLASIAMKTGWRPTDAFFNNRRLPPPAFKRIAVVKDIFPRYGDGPAGYFGLESNPRTRDVYEKLGINSISVETGPWQKLPV